MGVLLAALALFLVFHPAHATVTICVGGGCAQTDGSWQGQDIVGMPVGTMDQIPVAVSDPNAIPTTPTMFEEGHALNTTPLTPAQVAAVGAPPTDYYYGCGGSGTLFDTKEAACTDQGLGLYTDSDGDWCADYSNPDPVTGLPSVICNVGQSTECPNRLVVGGATTCMMDTSDNSQSDLYFDENGNPVDVDSDIAGKIPPKDTYGGYTQPIACEGTNCQAGFVPLVGGGAMYYSEEDGFSGSTGQGDGTPTRRRCSTTVQNGQVSGGCTYEDIATGNPVSGGTYTPTNGNPDATTTPITPPSSGYVDHTAPNTGFVGGGTSGGSTGGNPPTPPTEPNCDPATDPNLCQGAFTDPAIGTAQTFSASGTGFYNALKNGPWGRSVSGISSALPPSTGCPAFNADVLGTTVSTTIHCDVMNGVAPLFSAVMLGVWSLLAVRIVLSA